MTIFALGVVAVVCLVFLSAYNVIALRFSEKPDSGRATLIRHLSMMASFALLALWVCLLALLVDTVEWLYSNSDASKYNTKAPAAFYYLSVFGSVATIGVIRQKMPKIVGRLLARRDNTESESAPAISPNAGGALPHFAAMQYYALMLNKTYEIFITDSMLCGAKVKGIVASPQVSVPAQLDQNYWIGTLSGMLYERLDVTSPTFLKLNWANFQIKWSDILRVEFDSSMKWGMGNVPYSGRIFVYLESGRYRELILLGKQDGLAVKQCLDEVIRLDRDKRRSTISEDVAKAE